MLGAARGLGLEATAGRIPARRPPLAGARSRAAAYLAKGSLSDQPQRLEVPGAQALALQAGEVSLARLVLCQGGCTSLGAQAVKPR